MLPVSVKPTYGSADPVGPRPRARKAHAVRPTSGLEFVSSRHFPDEVQGDMLLCNTIGFLGIKQHSIVDDGTGYKTEFRQDLLKSSDGNFRPVDLEFAPDGSLYVIDWHNVLIGHMQHNARDPLRDHVHGRIYRITYPSRPLVKPALVEKAPVATLLENLKLPEYRTRYRSRRELRSHPAAEVLPAAQGVGRQARPQGPALRAPPARSAVDHLGPEPGRRTAAPPAPAKPRTSTSAPPPCGCSATTPTASPTTPRCWKKPPPIPTAACASKRSSPDPG